MLISMDVVVIVIYDNARFPGKMVQTQMIVVVDPRAVMAGKTVVEIQSRHRHGDARVRRPHTLKRNIDIA